MKKLLFILSLCATSRLFAVAPVPFTQNVNASTRLTTTGALSSTLTIYGETTTTITNSTTGGTNVDSATSLFGLKPFKSYAMNMAGGTSGSSTYQLSFTAPSGYAVYINNLPADLQQQTYTGTGSFSDDYTLEIRPVSSVDSAAWGKFSGISLGNSITWGVGLGALRTGRGAGMIMFKEANLSNSPASRDRLYYTVPDNVSQIAINYDGGSGQTLRQIFTPAGFTDLVDVTNGYEIRFYTALSGSSGGLWTFTGLTPWKKISVISSATNQLTITETQGSVVHVSSLSAPAPATGGTITGSSGYTIHTFNSSGTITFTNSAAADYLVVGGGGGGGSYSSNAGGGGAGSVEFLTNQTIGAGSYSVTVGSGGASDTNGSNSTFNGTTAYGGGHGGNNSGGGASGGSGGGGVVNDNTGSPGSAGSGSNVYGGGVGDNGSHGWPAGGGGGAGGVGGGLSLGVFGGGNGIMNSITGSSVYYGGGGGGGTIGGAIDFGGSGGGGVGGYNSNGVAGTANTGGGGGGAYGGYSGGAGGSGVVVIRYPSPWTLQEGDGTTWLRTTTHTSSTPGSGQRDDTVIVRTGGTSGTIVSKTKYHYVMQAWGEELASVIADPDTNALTTSYTYYTDSTAPGNYTQVKSITQPTGNWVAYSYYDDYAKRGQLYQEFHPYLDSPSTVPSTLDPTTGRVLTLTYTYDWTGRYRDFYTQTEKINNVQTGYTSRDPDYDSSTTLPRERYNQNAYSDATHLQFTTVQYYRDDAGDADYVGQPVLTIPPNIAQVTSSYSRGTYNVSTKAFTVGSSGDHWRKLEFHGSYTSAGGAEAVTTFNSQSCDSVYMLPNQSTLNVTIWIANGDLYRTETWVYTGSGSFSLMTSEDFTYDAYGNLIQRLANNGAMTSYTYTDGQLTSTFDPTGTETDFTYDVLGRVATSVKKGASAGTYAAQGDITTTNTYDGANHVTQTVTSGSSLSLTATAAYDLAGRQTSSTAPGSYTTSYGYSSNSRIVTATLPGGATKINEVYTDGQPKSQTGTAVVAQYDTYSVNGTTGNITQQVNVGTSSSTNQVQSTADWEGRTITQVKPGWNGSNVTSTWTYDNYYGYLNKVTQPGMADTLYFYDTMGNLKTEGLDINANGTLDPSSSDRITVHGWTYFSSSSNWWRRDTTSTYATANNTTLTQTGKVETQLSGFTAAGSGYTRLARKDTYDVFGNVTTAYTEVAAYGKMAVSTTVVPNSTTNAVQTAYNGLLMSSQDTAGVTMTYGYDALGRQTTSTDPRTGTTTTAYVSGTSQVLSITDPASVTQATYTYDSAGRVATVTNALSKVCRYAYTNRNEKYHVWGDTDYPVEYGYDNWGHQTTMSTYRGGSGWTGTSWPTSTTGTADTTTWAFQEATGLLSSKTDAAGKAVSYTYTQAGQIATRLWARILTGTTHATTTYGYDSTTGELTSVTYNDGVSFNLAYTYNRLGQTASVADRTGTHNFDYNLGGTLELQDETFSTNYYGTGRRLTYTYATSGDIGRPTGFGVGTSGSPTADQSIVYSYDSATGRLSSVAGGGHTFSYGYATNSNLVSTVTDSAANYVDTRTYNSTHDWVSDRKTTISSVIRAEFAYTPDTLGRTTQVAKTSATGGIYDRYGNGTEGLTTYYGYDDHSQLTSEVTKVGTSTTVLTGRNDSAYAYDIIGNRSSRTHNSNSTSYTTNSLNQYTQRDVTGIFDVAGAAGTGTTVTVSKSGGSTDTATRHGQYFFDGYGLTNTSTPPYATLTVSDGTTNTNVLAYIAKTAEPFSYDDDGNLKSDGRWNYTYDGENRLITAETIPAAVTAGVTRQLLTYGYDYLGRRVLRGCASGWNGSAYTTSPYWLRYLYNGWNIAAEVDDNNGDVVTKTFVWGLDLAGPGQKAGGIGALLLTQDGSNAYLPIYDGNGNIHGMITAGSVTLNGNAYAAGAVVAAYEYDAFGNTLRASGDYAATNLFGYSTKVTDVETSLVYYGTRFYSPSQGRFINRDTIEEQGGLNLYAFVNNNGVNSFDVLGRDNFMVVDQYGQWWQGDGMDSQDRQNAAVSSMQPGWEQMAEQSMAAAADQADRTQLDKAIAAAKSNDKSDSAVSAEKWVATAVLMGDGYISNALTNGYNAMVADFANRAQELLNGARISSDNAGGSALKDAPAPSSAKGLLSWSDFQGKPPNDSHAEGAQYAYHVYGEITRSEVKGSGNNWTATLLDFEAGAEMDPSQSWVDPAVLAAGGNAADYLLRHESGHDRITTQGGQDLVNALTGLRVIGTTQEGATNTLYTQFNSIVDIWTQNIAWQNKFYDQTTNHGTNKAVQNVYNKRWGF
jgi:RHS repeat-associated protein